MELGTASNIASLLGLAASIAIAIHQHRQALSAQHEAKQQRDRAATLEGHLSRQQWQQLRSIGEQIDVIEESGRHQHFPLESALHARLKEQFSSLLGIIATSTHGYSASTVRHWVDTGRLRRPWQIAEAISHVASPGDSKNSPDDAWLKSLIEGGEVLDRPVPVAQPEELTEHVAAYILVANSIAGELAQYIVGSGQAEYNATVLVSHLANDCIELSSDSHIAKTTRMTLRPDGKSSFREYAAAYNKLHFWTMTYAAEEAQRRVKPFRDLFLQGKTSVSTLILPTEQAVVLARARFPKLLGALTELWRSAV